jgi:hypothetical protein
VKWWLSPSAVGCGSSVLSCCGRLLQVVMAVYLMRLAVIKVLVAVVAGGRF